MIKIIGVYDVNPAVHLIEMIINDRPSHVNVDEFTQEIPNVSSDEWQVAYDEHYLNEPGDKVIGDFFDKPIEDTYPTRLTFFLYYIDFKIPLKTPFGEVSLPSPIPLPKRLKEIIEFEDVD